MNPTILAVSVGSLFLLAGCTETVGGGSPETGSTDTGSTDTGSTSAEPESSPFSLKIENASAARIFVRGFPTLPFTVTDGAQGTLPLTAECSCGVCGSGNECWPQDWLPTAVEIPPGESLVYGDPLSRFLAQPLSPHSCPELVGQGSCLQAHALAAGDYALHVDYDGEEILTAQGLSEGGTQWGLKAWTSGYAFTTIELGKTTTQAFSMTDAGAVVEVTISE